MHTDLQPIRKRIGKNIILKNQKFKLIVAEKTPITTQADAQKHHKTHLNDSLGLPFFVKMQQLAEALTVVQI